MAKSSKSEQDPTNQARTRRNANRANNKRLNNAGKSIIAEWNKVESTLVKEKIIINETINVYEYDLTPEQIELFRNFIVYELNKELETEQEVVPFGWYYTEYVEEPYYSGVIQEQQNVENLFSDAVEDGIIGGIIGAILAQFSRTSTTFISTVTQYVNEDYSLIKSLSDKTASQVYQVITNGIDSGLSKTAIRREIIKRIEVSKSNAKRIVDTEVNKIYNNARMDTVKQYNKMGANLAVQHISALLPTTREWHAARHGKVYTPAQQRRWWDSGSNRINCHCSVRSVRLNAKGEIMNKGSVDRVKKRGVEFFG